MEVASLAEERILTELKYLLGLPIDKEKVDQLAMDIELRSDPTKLILTVVPEEPTSFSIEEAENASYKVVDGRHRCLALKKLKEEDKLSSVLTVEEGFVEVFVIADDKLYMKGHLYLKGNDISSRHINPPTCYQIAVILTCLASYYSEEKSQEIAGRYLNSLRVNEKLREACKRWCKWRNDDKKVGLQLIEKYEKRGD